MLHSVLVYDLALGDIVQTDEDYIVNRVVRRSGRYVFRVITSTDDASARRSLIERLAGCGVRLEWQSARHAAIDVPTEAESRVLARLVWEGEQAGNWSYESGRSGSADV